MSKAVTRKYNALVAAGRKPFAYSGRFMYGKYCIAVRGERGDKFPGASYDSLGLGIVAYWPVYEWDDATMKEAEEA